MENYEAFIRFGSFLGVFITFAILETVLPDRTRKMKRMQRWSGAFALLFLGGFFAKLILPLGLAVIAIWAKNNDFGILNQFSSFPAWGVFVLSFLALDLAIWAQHVATHKIGFLWRLHRVHHTDPDVDVSTALRFHPAEIALSLGWKVAVVILLGASAEAVLWFQIVLNASALFNHANVKLPDRLDSVLRPLIVTPAMHRVHHSILQKESDTNYGFFLSIWDRIFGTYTAQFSEAGKAQIGQVNFQSQKDQRPDQLFIQPLRTEN
ncbi:sterol desaturase family protein [Hirschia litorea]|uniref:Sterol desaturase family protein n=1 Tax=Hirschia litorea TaxID=1199156 RepID=A0ABW2IJ47_9PROT